jgi:hypothetical protein
MKIPHIFNLKLSSNSLVEVEISFKYLPEHFHIVHCTLYSPPTLNPVTDLGFTCRGAEHLLLLLDTIKTSFIAENFRGD